MKLMKRFAPGILAALIICLLLQTVSVVLTVYIFYFLLMGTSAALGIISGLMIWIFSGHKSTLTNAFKILGGNINTSEKQTFFSALLQVLLRHTWEMPQTVLGHFYLQIQNIVVLKKRVDYWGGATFLILENQKTRKGISIGSFINVYIKDEIKGDFETAITKGMLFMHEYGHTFDSRIYGIFFLPLIGLPSLISAATAKPVAGTKGVLTHDFRWYELSANRHAAHYFKKYYSFDWKVFEDLYPLQKPSDYA